MPKVKYSKKEIDAMIAPELKKDAIYIPSWIMRLLITKQCSKLLVKLQAKRTYMSEIPRKLKVDIVRIAGVQVYMYTPKDLLDSVTPCVVYYHGGAFQLSDDKFQHKNCWEYALKARCRVAFVIYTLSCRKAFPKPLNDCYSVLKEISNHADQYNVDARRIVIMGDSAGGYFTAAVSLMARDRGIALRKQFLIYPTIDQRCMTRSIHQFAPAPFGNGKIMPVLWNNFLKDGIPKGYEDYAALYQVKSLEGVCPAYLEVNEVDALRDEGLAYKKKLIKDGIPVEYYYNKGCYHLFDMNPSTYRMIAMKRRINALRGAFNERDEEE